MKDSTVIMLVGGATILATGAMIYVQWSHTKTVLDNLKPEPVEKSTDKSGGLSTDGGYGYIPELVGGGGGGNKPVVITPPTTSGTDKADTPANKATS